MEYLTKEFCDLSNFMDIIHYTHTIENGVALFDAEESRHIGKVLRLQTGDNITFFDGKGNLYSGVLDTIDPKRFVSAGKIRLEKIQVPPPIDVILPLLHNKSRIEWMVEKCTEIGVQSIYLTSMDHSEKSNVSLDRLQKIVLSAAKQSHHYFLPSLYHIKSIQESLNKLNKPFTQIVYGAQASHLSVEDIPMTSEPTAFILVVGPEGDFSKSEYTFFDSIKATGLNLGTARLRSETAALVLLDRIHMIFDKKVCP